ncbi:hypothetical protein CWE09_13165 [Aliidiomarina minuta]|uniref:Spore coat protein U domain-containing protein n=1 Tax=Aliidiomarina minuta TaxID=880057 RepID=A0A432W417_9GAMM|nr:hypothetical protein [Aliidiomarina minuta]RUO24087.1 hypothetical protein CWE09_13165 [Aliidiomarina minuta]
MIVRYKAYLALAILLLMVSDAGATKDNECSGSWLITVHETRTEFTAGNEVAAWLPAELRLSGALVDCVDYMLIGPGDGSSWWIDSGFERLEVTPYDARRNPLLIPRQGDGWLLPLPGQQEQHSFWLRVANARQAVPGVYRGLIESEPGSRRISHMPLLRESTALEFVVEPRVSLHLDSLNGGWSGGKNSYFRVGLGVLHSGLTREFDVVLNSNTDVSLEISSQNLGLLRHTERYSATIPYQLRVNWQSVDLTGVGMVHLPRQGNNWRVPMQVSVPYVSDFALAGEYSDVITINAYAQE